MHSEANRKKSGGKRQLKTNANAPATNHKAAPNRALLRSYDSDDQRKMLKKAISLGERRTTNAIE